MTDTLYRWVKASERLGEFHDSDIPSWKFFNPDFCRVQGQPVPQGWFRKDIESGATVFSYYYTAGANFTNEIKEDKFRQIEWLEPYTPSPSSSGVDATVLVDTLKYLLFWYNQVADGRAAKNYDVVNRVNYVLGQYNALPGSQGGQNGRRKYFIEDLRTGKWLCLGDPIDTSKDMVAQSESRWTNDPNVALSWNNKKEAEDYNKKYWNMADIEVTEHDFISYKPQSTLPNKIEESGLKEGEDDPDEFIISEIFKQWIVDDWQDEKGQAERFAAYLDTHYRTIEK